jgi:hypothetical protein
MDIDDPRTWGVLRRIVASLSDNLTLQQDLMQECAVHLCQVEREQPDHTTSWYLLSCRFHARHWMTAGRSVDSLKRASQRAIHQIDGVVEDEFSEANHTNGDVMEQICARDLAVTLLCRLGPREQIVFRGLAAGSTLREIASDHDMSYPTALRYRRKIASLVSELDRPSPGWQASAALPWR